MNASVTGDPNIENMKSSGFFLLNQVVFSFSVKKKF